MQNLLRCRCQDEPSCMVDVLEKTLNTSLWTAHMHDKAGRFSPLLADNLGLVFLGQRLGMSVETCVDYGWSKCAVEGDCGLAIQKIDSSNRDFSSISPIIEDIISMCPIDNSISFRWVRRYANAVDHLLAQAAISSNEGTSPLPLLLDVLRADAPD
ncbi:hypothetical protein Salat_2434600 [Sesamum alatum]|uniref:RNase H type-1 domain-containing protein n=1 Tax=Sesamum alatum TaxID=300844 RepID=A0AAE2CFG1_9LAMI|nr:hypothetical protein Salat_2434600 [Sesamum alatum]